MVNFFYTKVKNLIFIILTLVQRFLMPVSTLLPTILLFFNLQIYCIIKRMRVPNPSRVRNSEKLSQLLLDLENSEYLLANFGFATFWSVRSQEVWIFQHSNLPIFSRRSGISANASTFNFPVFQHPIFPIFHYSIIPSFHYSILPIFHPSNLPSSQSSILPLFHLSILPFFHHSIFPLFQ